MMLDGMILLLALVLALALRPWRLLAGGHLLSPLLACLVLLPWLWSWPRWHSMPLPLQFSGACATTLLLGWPLAVPVLVVVAGIAGLLAPAPDAVLLAQAVWQGIVPASLALGVGAALRAAFGPRLFVYILGRAFFGTVLSNFVAQWLCPSPNASDLSLVAAWLMAWGDGFMTGMLAAIAVAFRPHWLATWSDQLYLMAPKVKPP